MVIKRYTIFICFFFMMSMVVLSWGKSIKNSGKVLQSKICVPLSMPGCNMCDMQDPRASRYTGIRFPRYFQGYPYYGYYLEGSSTGYSWSV